MSDFGPGTLLHWLWCRSPDFERRVNEALVQRVKDWKAEQDRVKKLERTVNRSVWNWINRSQK